MTIPETPLTRRESQVAELIAWGASKKEVPELLQKLYGGSEISVHTVENTLRSVFVKIHISKATELSVWWFCKFCGADSSCSPFKRLQETLIGIFLFLIILPQTVNTDMSAIRPQRARTIRTERVQRRKD